MTHSDICNITGACLCGAVRFEGKVAGRDLRACHCGQCRRWSGHVWAGVSVPDLRIEGDDSLRWFRSSDRASRGFCALCGSSLFWRATGSDVTDVAPGAIDAPTGLRLQGHIHVADKGDYYDIGDGLPQHAGGSGDASAGGGGDAGNGDGARDTRGGGA